MHTADRSWGLNTGMRYHMACLVSVRAHIAHDLVKMHLLGNVLQLMEANIFEYIRGVSADLLKYWLASVD